MKKFLLSIFVLFILAIAVVAYSLVSTDGVVTIQNGRSARETVAAVTAAGNAVGDPIAGKSIEATAGNITITQKADGGNADSKYEFIGLPRIKLMSLGTGTNGATAAHTQVLTDDTPDGEWTAVDAGTTVTADTTYYRVGAKSLKILFKTTATTASGAQVTESSINLSTDTSVGAWIYTNKALAAGDLVLKITDTVAGVTSVNVPAVATINKWTWVEIDISGVTSTSRDVVSKLAITLSTAGVVKSTASAFSVYIDFMVAWASSDEISLGVPVLNGGVLGVTGTTYSTISVVTGVSVIGSNPPVTSVTPSSGTVMSMIVGENLVAYTGYFVAYRGTSASVIVPITDQSATVLTALFAY